MNFEMYVYHNETTSKLAKKLINAKWPKQSNLDLEYNRHLNKFKSKLSKSAQIPPSCSTVINFLTTS